MKDENHNCVHSAVHFEGGPIPNNGKVSESLLFIASTNMWFFCLSLLHKHTRQWSLMF